MLQNASNINNFFSKQDIIHIDDVRRYFRLQQPTIKDNAIGLRIHALKEAGVLQSVGKGKYSLQSKTVFKPSLTDDIKQIAAIIEIHFDIDYCISTAAWLNEFSLHQAFHEMLIIEAEKDFLRSLFDILREGGKREVYLNPDKKVVELYVNTAQFPIVLKPLISRAPTQKIANVVVPSLEKMLVDVFADTIIFQAYQDSELIYIFEHAIRLCAIDYDRLLAYAARRKKKTKLRTFLQQKVKNFPKTVLDDTP